MKKLLTVTLGVVMLAAFADLSVAKPPADMVTLSAAQNVVSQKGCPVTARPGRSADPNQIFPDYHSVNFEKWVNNIWVAWGQPTVTNSQGVTPSQTVPWNTKIRAWIYLVAPNQPKAYKQYLRLRRGSGISQIMREPIAGQGAPCPAIGSNPSCRLCI